MRKFVAALALAPVVVAGLLVAPPAAAGDGPAPVAGDIDLVAGETYRNDAGTRERTATCQVNVYRPADVRRTEDIVVRGRVTCNVKILAGSTIGVWVQDRIESSGVDTDFDSAVVRPNPDTDYRTGTFALRYATAYRWATGSWDAMEPGLELRYRNSFNQDAELLTGYNPDYVERFTVRS